MNRLIRRTGPALFDAWTLSRRNHEHGAKNASTILVRIQHPLEAAHHVLDRALAVMRALANRRAVNRLAQLDDYLLKDIGLSRTDVESALSAPAWHDPSEQLAGRIGSKRDAARARRAEFSGHRQQMKWL